MRILRTLRPLQSSSKYRTVRMSNFFCLLCEEPRSKEYHARNRQKNPKPGICSRRQCQEVVEIVAIHLSQEWGNKFPFRNDSTESGEARVVIDIRIINSRKEEIAELSGESSLGHMIELPGDHALGVDPPNPNRKRKPTRIARHR